MYILHTHVYRYERVYTIYIHIIKFIYVYVHTTYIYVLLCTCINMDIHVHECMNMYIHVCTMFRHVYTVLQYPLHVGRIPDGRKTWTLTRAAASCALLLPLPSPISFNMLSFLTTQDLEVGASFNIATPTNNVDSAYNLLKLS
jgi:hypothetical protein